jgi:hypothetical protein
MVAKFKSKVRFPFFGTPNAHEIAQKIKKTYFVNVSMQFNFSPITGLVFFIFLKKVKFVTLIMYFSDTVWSICAEDLYVF